MGKRFTQVYDLLMWPLEAGKLKTIRKRLINKAEGRVLEIGSGTGINFPYYPKEIRVDAVDPDPMMRKKSIIRLKKLNKKRITTHLAGAERLPFCDDTFDTVIGTLVFCTIPNPEQALRELYRVSKPGAKMFLLEHVKMKQTWAAGLQETLTPVWRQICGGCHLNRDPLYLIQRSDWQENKTSSFSKGLFLAIEAEKHVRNS